MIDLPKHVYFEFFSHDCYCIKCEMPGFMKLNSMKAHLELVYFFAMIKVISY